MLSSTVEAVNWTLGVGRWEHAWIGRVKEIGGNIPCVGLKFWGLNGGGWRWGGDVRICLIPHSFAGWSGPVSVLDNTVGTQKMGAESLCLR